MALSNGPNLGLLVNAAQGEAHFAAQQKLLRGLDALVQPSVKDKDLATPPGVPADGDRYIVAAAPTGAWVGHVAEIARWSSVATAWEFYVPKAGWRMYVEDEQLIYRHNGTAWSAIVIRKTSLTQVLPNVSVGNNNDFWPDAVLTDTQFYMHIPDDYISGDMTFKVFRRANVTSNTARMQWRALRLRDGSVGIVIVAFIDVNFTPNDLVVHLLTMVVPEADFSIGDVIRVDVRRLGADAADTMLGLVSFDGAWVEYAAGPE